MLLFFFTSPHKLAGRRRFVACGASSKSAKLLIPAVAGCGCVPLAMAIEDIDIDMVLESPLAESDESDENEALSLLLCS